MYIICFKSYLCSVKVYNAFKKGKENVTVKNWSCDK